MTPLVLTQHYAWYFGVVAYLTEILFFVTFVLEWDSTHSINPIVPIGFMVCLGFSDSIGGIYMFHR